MIRGETVGLDALRCSDSATLLGWINHPETVRFSAGYKPVHEVQHRTWLENVTRDASRVIFAVRDLASDDLIGVVQLIDIQTVHRSTELIIRIGEPKNRSQGAGTEAIRLATRFAFDDYNLRRVWLRVFADNGRAVRAYEKAGFKLEGRLRQACFIDGRWRDELIMALLAEEAGAQDALMRVAEPPAV